MFTERALIVEDQSCMNACFLHPLYIYILYENNVHGRPYGPGIRGTQVKSSVRMKKT